MADHRRPPSLADVARDAAVSLATASRALDPASTHPISDATRQRVHAVASRLGYQPNPMARGLRTQRLGTLAVVVHDISDPYFAEVVRGAAGAASDAGLPTIVCSSERTPALELKNLQMLRQMRVAGILFAGSGITDPNHERKVAALVREIGSYGGAVVALAPRSERWPAEVCDNRGGAVAAARHLVELGHRQIAIVSGPPQVRASMERVAGYRDVLSKVGIDAPMVAAEFNYETGQQAAAELLTRDLPFTAVLAANDAMAMGVMAEFRRRKVRVPDEVSLVGFGDIPGASYLFPSLTTVRVPAARLGIAGVRRSLELLSGVSRLPRVRVHPVELVVRESTGVPCRETGLSR
ncbi:MAG: LacI family DNA-binding transcriptional regulator [Candidatus Dormibacteraeota bacterium]|nr:LacI family DNA-binding transcriptional regulator [Candidatus Dormibacteraeota bacterium]